MKLAKLPWKEEFSRGQCYYPKAYVRDRSKEETKKSKENKSVASNETINQGKEVVVALGESTRLFT